MTFGLAAYGLALLAGVLSILSPCVLPLLPIVLGSAVLAHRLGPLALAGGLLVSFTLVGTLIAAVGASIGLDQQLLRQLAAGLLLLFGLVLLLPGWQQKFAAAASGLSSSGQSWVAGLTLDGLAGQFVLGLLLGLVWSPCVGPTLGAAITLASQGENLPQVALVMLVFSLGASLLLLLGMLSRQALARWRGKLLKAGKRGKQLLGLLMLALGVAIVSGSDKLLEAWVLRHAPDWLIALTARF